MHYPVVFSINNGQQIPHQVARLVDEVIRFDRDEELFWCGFIPETKMDDDIRGVVNTNDGQLFGLVNGVVVKSEMTDIFNQELIENADRTNMGIIAGLMNGLQ